MKIYLFTLLASVALPAFIFAQTTTSAISGRITAADGTPLAGASIMAIHMPTATQYGPTADTNGLYRLNGIRVGGPYTIEISFVGYKDAKYENIRLELGETKEINVSLKESANSIEAVAVMCYYPVHNMNTNNFNNSVIEKMPTI